MIQEIHKWCGGQIIVDSMPKGKVKKTCIKCGEWFIFSAFETREIELN